MKPDIPKWTKWIVLIVLLGYTTYLIIKPTLDLFDNSTLTVTINEETKDKLEPFKWPSVLVCKNPIINDKESYDTFMNKVYQGTLDTEAEKRAFYTDPTDYLYNISVSPDFHTTMFTNHSLRWPLEPPYVNMFVSEYQYNGYCIEVSLEAIRNEKIKRGELDGNAIDTTFTAVFWLKSMENEHSYNVIDFIEDGETSLMTTRGSVLKMKNNHVAIYSVEFGEEDRIQNCQKSSDLMSDCVLNHLKAKHGDNTFMMYVDLGLARVSGLQYLANYTGCLQPCQRTVYKPNEYFTAPLEFTNNPQAQAIFPKDQENNPLGTLMIINHVKQSSFSKHQEQHYYTAQSYISDVGGISGIFLGFSFLSIYELLFHPILQKLFGQH